MIPFLVVENPQDPQCLSESVDSSGPGRAFAVEGCVHVSELLRAGGASAMGKAGETDQPHYPNSVPNACLMKIGWCLSISKITTCNNLLNSRLAYCKGNGSFSEQAYLQKIKDGCVRPMCHFSENLIVPRNKLQLSAYFWGVLRPIFPTKLLGLQGVPQNLDAASKMLGSFLSSLILGCCVYPVRSQSVLVKCSNFHSQANVNSGANPRAINPGQTSDRRQKLTRWPSSVPPSANHNQIFPNFFPRPHLLHSFCLAIVVTQAFFIVMLL